MTGLSQETSSETTPTTLAAEHAPTSLDTAQPEAKKTEAVSASPANPFGDENSATTRTTTDTSAAQGSVLDPSGQPESQETAAHPELPPRIPPEVEGLMAMFPDFDAMIVQSVLQSVDGNQERAADILLGMSDPEYVSQSHTAQPPQERELSQEELDEQLARRLVFEEQQQAQIQQQANWHPDEMYPGQQYQGQNFGQRRDVPYQPRQGGAQGQPGQGGQWNGQQGGGKDTMSEVQEQLSKFAETGKKTFSSIVSKVKAKMQEFDQNRNSGSSSNPSQPQASWSSGTPSSQGAQYYAPMAGRTDHSRPIGYDVAPQPQQGTTATRAAEAPLATSAVSTPGSEIAISSSPPPVTAPRPPSTGPPPLNVDPTKIGMLPKRPVSLLGSTPAQSSATRRADDEELDYVENPFEDERH